MWVIHEWSNDKKNDGVLFYQTTKRHILCILKLFTRFPFFLKHDEFNSMAFPWLNVCFTMNKTSEKSINSIWFGVFRGESQKKYRKIKSREINLKCN